MQWLRVMSCFLCCLPCLWDGVLAVEYFAAKGCFWFFTIAADVTAAMALHLRAVTCLTTAVCGFFRNGIIRV